jgi:spore coat protein A, manganese oxidase
VTPHAASSLEERRIAVKRPLLVLAAVSLGLALATSAPSQVRQVPLDPLRIPQFVEPLPQLGPNGLPVATGAINKKTGNQELTLSMCEFQANVLPTGTFQPGVAPSTWVWGYVQGATCPKSLVPHAYIGPVVVAHRGTPTQVTYLNQLGSTATSKVLAYTQSTDLTLHWADPLNNELNVCAMDPFLAGCDLHYNGPIPAVPHLHGGEVPPVLDGGPDAWFTSNGLRGHGYYTKGRRDPVNGAVYVYPNTQEGALIWFHDHTLGATRLNVYAGLAGAYLLQDPLHDPANLPEAVPLVIQDRQFDTNGQLYFPNLGLNPEHPYWVPEFVGDVIVVNGKAWPYLNVAPKRYTFLVLNGSNARAYELSLVNPVTGSFGPPLWVIGTDGGYLDTPVQIDPAAAKPLDKLVVMPGERYLVIADFAGYDGQTLELRNSAKTPYPNGAPVSGRTTARVMRFQVTLPSVADASYNPASLGSLRSPMERLVEPETGRAVVNPDKVRQLTLNEAMGPGGPLEVLVNNTKWTGKNEDGSVRTDFTAVTAGAGGVAYYYSELPVEGDTELWEIINLTADAHPIHLHLAQFQLLNRQAFNLRVYDATYNASFPGGGIDPMSKTVPKAPYPPGVYMPAYGPPLDYATGSPAALGGNPDVTPFLVGAPLPPLPQEWGWKDTVTMHPGQVTRILVRWAPTDKPTTSRKADLFYPFDPDDGHGYVWHCHIIDHEDNEMMRPMQVNTNPLVPSSSRTFVKGKQY